MIKLDLWKGDGFLEEASKRGEIVSRKSWTEKTARACVELLSFNLERGYHYHLYACFDHPNQTRETIHEMVAISIGNIKWIGLLLYEKIEKNPYDEPWETYQLGKLREKLAKNNKEIEGLAQKLVSDQLKSNMRPRKDVVTEYELSIRYMIRRNDNKRILCVIGPNYRSDEIAANCHEDLAKMGKITSFVVPEVKGIRLIDLVEQDNSLVAKIETTS